MAIIRMDAGKLTHRVEVRDGRTVVVLAQGDDELVIVPPETDGWVAIWGLSLAFDRRSGEVRQAEHNGFHRGRSAPPAVVQSPFGGPESGAG